MIRRQTTKELIAESLKELFTQKTADKITVKEIARNCGITPATFYNHFRDKYDLIVWIYAEPVKNIVCQMGKKNLRNLTFVKINFQWLRESVFQNLYKFFTRYRHIVYKPFELSRKRTISTAFQLQAAIRLTFDFL